MRPGERGAQEATQELRSSRTGPSLASSSIAPIEGGAAAASCHPGAQPPRSCTPRLSASYWELENFSRWLV